MRHRRWQPKFLSTTGVASFPMYEIEDASFSIGGRGFAASVDPDAMRATRVWGLIDHNGSGKSTLLKLLACQQRPTSGSVRFAGTPFAHGTTARWRLRWLICDGLIALKGGRMLTSGPAADPLRSDTLEEIYGVPMGIVPHPKGGAPVSVSY
jgi:ABC-type cobalamin/Fe3+-siderophores transport system ATPase subunit